MDVKVAQNELRGLFLKSTGQKSEETQAHAANATKGVTQEAFKAQEETIKQLRGEVDRTNMAIETLISV